MRRRVIRENQGSMKPGQEIVAAGFAGMAGAQMIAREKQEELKLHFSSSYIEGIYKDRIRKTDRNLEQWKQSGATEWEPAGEGGILTALWNLSGAYDVGIEVTLRQIPVKQDTIEICEYYDLNPYRLFSEGCFLLIGDYGGRLVQKLRQEGISSAVIGQVTEGNKMEILMEEGIACLERPRADELEKVIPGWRQG
ncbi:AIR synthase-related protein [Lachnospiraceae bacterium 62-35]